MNKNVISFVNMKDRMSSREVADSTSFSIDPTWNQLSELLERLVQELTNFCSDMSRAIEADEVSGKERSELMLCQLRVLQDVLRAIAGLTTILPRTVPLHRRGRPHNGGLRTDVNPLHENV